jgi:hypothetical protein
MGDRGRERKREKERERESSSFKDTRRLHAHDLV